MQQLNIPVIATRVGSLEERISDGETGWLIEPEASALIDRVRTLAADRNQIHSIHQRLKEFDLPGTGQMVRKYEKICLPRQALRSFTRTQSLDEARASSLAFQITELSARNSNLKEQAETLQSEVEERSAWAEEREKERKKEVDRRVRWVTALESQVAETEGNLEYEQAAHRQTNLWFEDLRSVHDWVLATASWRFTRPFRVLGRVFGNLAHARAWNPLRWPLLLSQGARTLGTQGFKGALERSQSTQTRAHRPESPAPISIEDIDRVDRQPGPAVRLPGNAGPASLNRHPRL